VPTLSSSCPGLTRASIGNANGRVKARPLSYSKVAVRVLSHLDLNLASFHTLFSDTRTVAMASFAIHWTKNDSKNFVDILPLAFFRTEIEDSEVEHRIRRPNGKTYPVRCKISVRKDVATLTYMEFNNRSDSVWPGVTRITFETGERKQIQLVEWQDEGDANFVDPSATWSEEPDATNPSKRFVVKTNKVEMRGKSLSLYARPIASMNGDDISLGDQVFVWVFENSGGKGIEWHGVVQGLDKHGSNSYRVTLSNLQMVSTSFGGGDIDKFENSKNDEEKRLYKKLKEYSHGGIRRIDEDEARPLFSLFFDEQENEGQSEVSRLVTLGKIASRPNQSIFSAKVRRAYQGKCAVTGCTTSEALEAAHINITDGLDDNDLRNGILLRADVHALFDRGLIALTLDGSRIETRAKLSDSSYEFLRTIRVSRPKDSPPSEANIRHHRLRVGFPSS
jgi:hypothetical protein